MSIIILVFISFTNRSCNTVCFIRQFHVDRTATAARIRRLGLARLGFDRDRSVSSGIRAEDGRVDVVAVVGVIGVVPGGIFSAGDGDAEVGRPWWGLGVGERSDAADGREEWAWKVRRVPRVLRDRFGLLEQPPL